MASMAGVVPSGLRERLKSSPEPAARWVVLTGLEQRATDDPEVAGAHADVLADPATRELLGRLHPWDEWRPVGGHDKPEYVPNLLRLLADRGIGAPDDGRIRQLHESMLSHQADDGRFLHLGRLRDGSEVWASLPCDHHAITEVLLRAGWLGDPRLDRALGILESRLSATAQGPAWFCEPDPQVRFRGPGRKGDACPQVTVEALRVFSLVPPDRRPPSLADSVRTTLGIWRRREQERPYMFGHGRQFKRGKWPALWYSAFSVVDAVGRYPEVWDGPDADPADRRALAELAACVVAYNFDGSGGVTPHSVYRGMEFDSLGQKRRTSDLAAALLAVALTRLEPLADDVHQIDPTRLGSSLGGSGSPLLP